MSTAESMRATTATRPRRERLVVEALDAGREPEWDAFVGSRPGSSHYQRAGWARVIASAFGHRPLYRIARVGDRIEGILPIVAFASPIFGKRLVSVPFLNRGGILAASPRAERALLDDAARLVAKTGSDFCELRHVDGVDPALPARTGKVSMSLELDADPDTVWKAIGAKVRNLVRKAEKEGAAVRQGDFDRDLDTFYALFAENMRELGTPVYSRRFFEEIVREFRESLRLNVVECDGRAAAAGICVTHGDFTEIHWAASRREFYRVRPNMLLYWDAIAHAARSGRREFCFGRSTKDSGPYRFKKQWGAEETPLRWEYVLAPGRSLPELSPDNPKFRLAIALWRRLPLGVTKILGPPIVRHLP